MSSSEDETGVKLFIIIIIIIIIITRANVFHQNGIQVLIDPGFSQWIHLQFLGNLRIDVLMQDFQFQF